jgi:hypothetical protein
MWWSVVLVSYFGSQVLTRLVTAFQIAVRLSFIIAKVLSFVGTLVVVVVGAGVVVVVVVNGGGEGPSPGGPFPDCGRGDA